MTETWEGTSQYRTSGDCPACGCQWQRLINEWTTRPAWRCTRCNQMTEIALPFDPVQSPEGHREGLLAIQTLSIYVPVFAKVDHEAVWRILRAYFDRGWCVRDVLHAMNYLPDGRTHSAPGVAWDLHEPTDKTLTRLMFRLRTWRWGDVDHAYGQDIMTGPYTAMKSAMLARGLQQQVHAAERAEQWQREAAVAQAARDRGAPAQARRMAALAAIQARQLRMAANAHEAELIRQRVIEARSPYGVTADVEPVEDSTPA